MLNLSKELQAKLAKRGVKEEDMIFNGTAYEWRCPNTGVDFILVEGNKEKDIPDMFMSKFKVTQKLYEQVTGENPSSFQGAYRPVESVNWFDCVNFCNELNKYLALEGLSDCYSKDKNGDVQYTLKGNSESGVQLPEAKHWEFAASGGNHSKGYKYPGSDDVDEVCWYDGNSDGETHPVGLLGPNELGIFGASGNCWTWTNTQL